MLLARPCLRLSLIHSSVVASINLPKEVGAILLPDCTLFPHGVLPLHIFEPRYREMLTEALEEHCIFCVACLTSEESPDPRACTAPVGTAGLIRVSRELPDGRSELILHGVCRVHFREWLPDRSFPYARIEPFQSVDVPPDEESAQEDRLREAVEVVLKSYPEDLATQVRLLLDHSADVFMMADAVAQHFVKEPNLRQTLLEEPEVSDRVDLLVDHLGQFRPGVN